MDSSHLGNISDKEKLHRELQFYTNLVSNHKKQLKTCQVKDLNHTLKQPLQNPVLHRTNLRSFKSNALSKKSITTRSYQRTIVQNKYNSYLKSSSASLTRPVQKPPLAGINKNLSPSYKTVNSNQRIVLPPQTHLKSTNNIALKPCVSSVQSNELQKALLKTKEAFMKIGSTKHINELNALAKQLVKQNENKGSLKVDDSLNKNSGNKMKMPESLRTATIVATVSHDNKSKLSNLQFKMESIAKILSAPSENSSNNIQSQSVSCSTKKVSPQVSTPSLIMMNPNVRNKLQPSSSVAKEPLRQVLINPKFLQINPSVKKELLLHSPSNIQNSTLKLSSRTVKQPMNTNIESPKLSPTHSLTSLVKKVNHQNPSSLKKHRRTAKVVSSKYKIVNKSLLNLPMQSSRNQCLRPVSVISSNTYDKKTKHKVAHTLKKLNTNYKIINHAKTPKQVTSFSKASASRSLLQSKHASPCALRRIKSNYKVVNLVKTPKKMNNSLLKAFASKSSIKDKLILKNRKENSTRVITPKFLRQSGQFPKLVTGSPIPYTNVMPKLTKINNCKIETHLKISPKPIFKRKSMIRAASNSKYKVTNKPSSSHSKITPKPIFKRKSMIQAASNSKYKVVNKPSSSHLKITPKPIFRKSMIQTASNSKYKVVNKPSSSHSKITPKPIFKRKSMIQATLHSKYTVVNKSSSSKKLSKSPSSFVRRTKSGVDIDLLLELAAENNLEKGTGIKTLRKRPVLLKRVYKTKNAIVNQNSCSTNTKVAKMIKDKYLLNKRTVWQKQLTSRSFMGYRHNQGKSFSASFYGTPKKPFYHSHYKRSYFKSAAQNQKYSRKMLQVHYGALHYNKAYQKSYFKNNYFKNEAKSTPISKVLASRVLHRSINRVISASTKKELSKVNKYCMFYNRFGRCNKGLKCTYVHDPRKIAVCTRFLRGTCKNDKCLFSHEVNPGKMAICSFFLLDSCTKVDCPYRHEELKPDAQLCKAFVQGYCPGGKQCTKAHILVCPKYVQGLCDKGDACAYPHPPQKEKKNLAKPVDKNEAPVEAEDLLEKVSRYFQPANEQRMEKTVVVPRRQALPEQPSFIAL